MIAQQHPMTCPDCQQPMVLRESRFGPFYGCIGFPACTTKVGAHKDGRPMGVPATAENRRARIRAHDALDKLWKEHGWRRTAVYNWLGVRLGLSKAECHIGHFDLATCYRVVEVVDQELREHPESLPPERRKKRNHYSRRNSRPVQSGPAAPARQPRDLNDARDQEDQ